MPSPLSRAALPLLLVAGLACGDPRPKGGPDDPACRAAPTWYQDVQPILGEHCQGCHVEGGIAGSLPWTAYQATQPWGPRIADVVSEGVMPPFIAQDAEDCVHRFPFLHDPRLDADQIQTLVDWVSCGQPEGDEATASPVPPPPVLALDDWDVELQALEGYAPSRGDIQVCFVVPVPDAWFEGGPPMRFIDAMEVLPQDLGAAHHIHVQLHPAGIEEQAGPDGWWECPNAGVWGGVELGGWLPGAPPTRLPIGAAFPIRPMDIIAFQVHYHVADDAPHFDQTRIRFRFADTPVYEPLMYRVGNSTSEATGLMPGPNDAGGAEFRIPAGVADHTETIRVQVPADPGTEFSAFVVSNHMHQVGVGMRMWVEHDPATKAADEPLQECLLATPSYDFDWQGFFYYDPLSGQAPKIRGGDHVKVECVYDNTTANRKWMEALAEEGLPQEPYDVVLGPEATDEMCASLVGTLRLP